MGGCSVCRAERNDMIGGRVRCVRVVVVIC